MTFILITDSQPVADHYLAVLGEDLLHLTTDQVVEMENNHFEKVKEVRAKLAEAGVQYGQTPVIGGGIKPRLIECQGAKFKGNDLLANITVNTAILGLNEGQTRTDLTTGEQTEAMNSFGRAVLRVEQIIDSQVNPDYNAFKAYADNLAKNPSTKWNENNFSVDLNMSRGTGLTHQYIQPCGEFGYILFSLEEVNIGIGSGIGHRVKDIQISEVELFSKTQTLEIQTQTTAIPRFVRPTAPAAPAPASVPASVPATPAAPRRASVNLPANPLKGLMNK